MKTRLASGTLVPARFCKHCRKLLRPKVFPGGHKEAPCMYGKRRFCDQWCWGAQSSIDRPLAKRFWDKVKKTKTCWLWTGVVGKDGYGHVHVSTKGQHAAGAHRVSWFLKHGRWPKLDVLHKPKCTSRLCVRPSHLYEGDDFDNCADKRTTGSLWHPPRGEKNASAVLTDVQAKEIKKALRYGSHGIGRVLARKYGVGTSTISRIRHGKVYP